MVIGLLLPPSYGIFPEQNTHLYIFYMFSDIVISKKIDVIFQKFQ